ncbi:MAG: hypothetical protein IJ858_06015 [Acidaminococcaceae bacterium]|nr:hypothetical protein [Acidaminococcaceae bacterium]
MNKSVNINITMPKAQTDLIVNSGKGEYTLNIAGGRGREGKSAYEVAVANGFVGTEQEWLDSLKVSCQNYASIYEFPNIGDAGVLYVDTGTNKMYRWDNDNLKYFCVGADWQEIGTINGGNA